MAEEKKKSKINPKTRQILDIIVTGIQVVIVIFCIVLSIIIWTGNAGDPINRKINWFAIRTDSMTRQSDEYYAALKEKLGCDFNVKKSTFDPGDMVITKKVAFEDIQVGDVIAYKATIKDINGNFSEQIITHRVVMINKNNKEITTRGDRDVNGEQETTVEYSNVFGKMTGKLKGIGGAILWLQGFRRIETENGVGYDRDENNSKSASFLIIIIPLAALFIYNGFYVVKWAMDERTKKIKEAAQKEAADKLATEAVNQKELERKAIRAFMASQGMTDEQIDAYFAKEDEKLAAQEAAKAEETSTEDSSADVEETVEQPAEEANSEEQESEEPKE